MHEALEHLGPGIREGIHRMAHAVDQALPVEGLLVQNLLQVGPDRVLVLPVGHIGLNLPHHLHHLDIGSAVLGPLQGGQRRRDDGIGVRARGCHHAGGKGGVVAAAMLHVQHQSGVQHRGLQLRVFHVRAQHHQQVLRRGQLPGGTVYVHAVVVLIVVIGMIPVHGQHGEHADQAEALPEHVLDGGIIAFLVIGCQCQHAPGQGVHDVAAGRFHDHVPGEIRGQRPAGDKNLPEILQLLLVRQLAEQQQIADFFKAEAPPLEALHQLDTVIAPIPQLTFAGCLHPIYHLKGLNARYIRKSRHHTVSVLVAQAPLHFILVEHLRLQMVGFSAHPCIIIQYDFVFLQ